MTEPVELDGEWWNQTEDGSWLKWDATAYRWDPHPTGPPNAAPPAPEPPAAAPPVSEGPDAEAPDNEHPAAEAAPPPPFPSPPSLAADRVRDFESADSKGRAATILVALTSLGFVAEAFLLLGNSSSVAKIVRSSASLSGISAFLSLTAIASGITVIIWCKGAYDNVFPLGASELRYKPWWAIGGWLIPIAFFFVPKQIVDDLWRTGAKELPSEEGSMWKNTPVPGMFQWWWALWITRWVILLAGNGMIRSAVEDNDVEQFKTAVKLVGISDLISAVAGVLLILVIRKITARQDERALSLAASSPERARALGVAPQG
jgi:hypothetical protein